MLKPTSKLILFLLIVIFNSVCGQTHTQNQIWLNNFNAVAKNTVVLNNQNQIIPLKSLENQQIASLNFGFTNVSVFDSLLNKYTHVQSVNANNYVANTFFNSVQNNIAAYNTLIISIGNAQKLSEQSIQFIKSLEKTKHLIITLYGDEENLARFDNFKSPIIYCPQQTPESAAFVAQLIFGGTSTNASLSKTISKNFIKGMGSIIDKCRLTFTVPEDANINTQNLTVIDSIVAQAIKTKATPGAVVFVAKNGKVIFNKAYGYHTYQNQTPAGVNDIFDLASISKLATTNLAMRLYETGKLNLDTVISAYLPQTKNTNKQNIKVRELLLHQAGLVPFIPFFEKLKIGDYSRISSPFFCVKVADSFYVAQNYYKNVMWPIMLNSPLKARGKYVYSDLSMYFLKEIIETITQQAIEDDAPEHFFNPLGMHTTGYLPRNRFTKNQIVPTEDDTYFRKTLLWGYVHDQGAAMVGGVAGHAGLFSNAADLATLFQMLLNKGSYGGQQYLKPETVRFFTAKQSNVSRRGLGFDRWDPDAKKEYPSKYASNQTFGHTGYTGTCVWVDAKHNLVYIFLSNRVHPRVNNKLSDLRIRTRILDAVYQAINKSN